MMTSSEKEREKQKLAFIDSSEQVGWLKMTECIRLGIVNRMDYSEWSHHGLNHSSIRSLTQSQHRMQPQIAPSFLVGEWCNPLIRWTKALWSNASSTWSHPNPYRFRLNAHEYKQKSNTIVSFPVNVRCTRPEWKELIFFVRIWPSQWLKQWTKNIRCDLRICRCGDQLVVNDRAWFDTALLECRLLTKLYANEAIQL